HRMKTVAGRYIYGNLQFIFEVLLDADQVESVEPAVRIVVDKKIEVAGRLRFVANCRTEHEKGSRAHGFDGWSALLQFGDCLDPAHLALRPVVGNLGRYSC